MHIHGKKVFCGKTVAVMLVMVLSLSLALLAGCGGGNGVPPEDGGDLADFAGYYAIDSIIMDGETLDADELAWMEIDYYIQLNENGTMEMSVDGLILGTWEKGVLYYTEDGEDVHTDFVLEGDILTIDVSDEEGEMIFIYKRSDESAETEDPGAEDPGEADPGEDEGQDGDAPAVEAHFSAAELEEIHALLDSAYDAWELREMNYEDVRDQFFDGVEGTIKFEGENTTIYAWYATDNDQAYVEVSFSAKEAGSEDRKGDGLSKYIP